MVETETVSESQHQSQSNEKSLVQFDYEKAVSNYLGTQSTFNPNGLTQGGRSFVTCSNLGSTLEGALQLLSKRHR